LGAAPVSERSSVVTLIAVATLPLIVAERVGIYPLLI